MATPRSPNRSTVLWWALLAVAAAYAVTGKIGLTVAFAGTNVSPVFPAAGLALAALLLGGYRMAFGVWIGALVLNLPNMPLWVAPWVALGNTLGPMAARILLPRFGWNGDFLHLRSITALIGAGLIGCSLSAANGTLALCSSGIIEWPLAPLAWWTWCTGDFMGVILICPLLCIWAKTGRHLPARRWLELSLIILISTIVCAFIFTPWTPITHAQSLSFIVMAPILWGAVRIGPAGATLIALLVSTIAVLGTVAGAGPFSVMESLNERLLSLQALLATAALLGMLLAAALQERRQAQSDLERVSLALDQARDLVFVTDASGHVVHANQTAIQRMGRGSLTGIPLRDLVITDQSLGSQGSLDASLITSKSEHIPVEAVFSPLLDGSGGSLCIVRDMSERRALHQRLAQASTLEALGRMAGGVAHDFNNLLAIILGFASLARNRLDPHHPARAAVERVEEAGTRAAAMTQQLLSVSRRQVIKPRQLDLGASIKEASSLLNALAGKDCPLAISSPSGIWVRSDPTQIQQILLNLVANARDAQSSGGEIRITLDAVELTEQQAKAFAVSDPVAAVSAKSGHWARLCVSDNGSGIDAETRQHLFEPFFTTKRYGRGTGLGLATILGIVRQSGGFLVVESAPGAGTRMVVHLPIIQRTAESSDESRASRTIGKLDILVCDDQPEIALLVSEMLSGLGMQVTQAHSAAAAMELLSSDAHFDLLITDVMLADGSGPDLARVARQHDPRIALLFMSGNPMDTRIDQTQATFLAKPMDRSRLLAAIENAINQRPARSHP